MHPECKNPDECAQKDIQNRCKEKCQKQAKKTLNSYERKQILFSLLYLEHKHNENLDSTVRSVLWLKASGASQYIETFSNYEV